MYNVAIIILLCTEHRYNVCTQTNEISLMQCNVIQGVTRSASFSLCVIGYMWLASI